MVKGGGWGGPPPTTEQGWSTIQHEARTSSGLATGGHLAGFFGPLEMGDDRQPDICAFLCG